nr:DUF5615 family PIN-like protein [Phormidesmis priestleyi]
MKLLYDQNLSPCLVDRLADLYPNSKHVYEIGLDQSNEGLCGLTPNTMTLSLYGFVEEIVRLATSKPCCDRTLTQFNP